MNREVKLRAWFLRGKEWVTPPRACYLDNDKKPYEFWGHSYPENLSLDVTITWSTGLKDKNGRDIYEGDIVKDLDNDSIWSVFWADHVVKFRVRSKDGFLDDHWLLENCEIIGNIFENPELLK